MQNCGLTSPAASWKNKLMTSVNKYAKKVHAPTPESTIGHIDFFWIFLKMGCVAFGGWLTTVVLLEKKFVSELGLLNKKQIGNAIASGQILPGAAQVIVAVQCAYYIRGTKGAIIAAFVYLLPSTLLTLSFSYLYFTFLANGDFTSRTLGLQAAVGGIILGNAYRIGKSNIGNHWLWFAVLPALAATWVLRIPTIYTILFYGIIGISIGLRKKVKSHD